MEGSFIQEIIQSDLLDRTIDDYIIYNVKVAEVIGVFFLVIAVLWNFFYTKMNSFLHGRLKVIDVKDIVRIVAIMFLIGTYPYVMDFVVYTTDLISEASRGDDQHILLEKKGEFFDSMKETQEEANNSGGTEEQELTDKGTSELVFDFVLGLSNPLNWMQALSFATVRFIGSIISLVVQFIAFYTSRLLMVIGPYVFAFSILPMFRDKLGKWFGALLNSLLVVVVCNVLDTLIYKAMNYSLFSGEHANTFGAIGFQVVIIILYIRAFWFAAFIVGSEQGGQVMSQAVQTASTVVSIAAGGMGLMNAAGAAGASSTASKAAGSAMSAAKDATSKNE